MTENDSSSTSGGSEDSSSHSILSLFGELIKSKQTFLLVYTTLFVYLISVWGSVIVIETLLILVLSLFLAISGSTLLNMYIDRDIDALMGRTKNRPIPSGKLSPRAVLAYGSIMTVTGILLCGLYLNLLTMLVVFAGFFFDVIVYSILLKRRTRFSILFGGIAGGLPALAGRTAVLGIIDFTGILFALFVICWIPLHILTLALFPKNLEGYRTAGVPMWPVVKGETPTIRVITTSAVISSVVVVISAMSLGFHLLALFPFALMSLVIILKSISNFNNPTFDQTFRIFKLASMFMAIAFLWLFVGLVIDPMLNEVFPVDTLWL
ncbi:MAG: heme o synthase [Candidatus Thorarchaeota archaeon]